MKITGCVNEIKFRNDSTNYTVFVLEQNDGNFVSAVGKIPPINIGQNLELEGEFTINFKFGRQFSIERVQFIEPTTKIGIYKYLSSGLIKGVGPTTAKNLIDYFGEDTLSIIELCPDRLVEVRGVSNAKAEQIARSYNSIREMQNTIIYLQKFEITTFTAVKIYDYYGPKTREVMEENPYKLVEDIEGIGFATADRIASKMGVLPNSKFRFRAGLLHILNESIEKSGNTYLPYDSATKQLFNLLKIEYGENEDDTNYNEVLEDVIDQLRLDDKVKIIEFDDSKGIILSKLYYTERNISYKILQLLEANSIPNFDVSKEILAYEKINNIQLHEKQKQAVSMAINNNISIITGGPGTGKTTIVKCLISILKSQRKKFILMAPTGRAAKRLSESTGEDAKTIHRGLDLNFATGKSRFNYDENNPLPYDVVIVDEVSMIDVFLMNSLLKALKRTAQLILVGDKNQLPSVGAGNVLADLLKSNKISTSTLTEIYRQDSKSFIITNAHAINNGEMPVLNNSSNDFFFEKKEDLGEMCDTIVELQSKRLPNYFKIEPYKIQVLAPLKNGICGVDNLNKRLQEKLNPKSSLKREIITERNIYRVGDKVMQIENNYEQEWTREVNGIYEDGLGVFNGDIGIIDDINTLSGELRIIFDDGRVSIYNRSNLDQLTLSYAITIHKSQGSEFDIVIIPAILGANTILTRNLLYTAVTRAKKVVMIVGTKFAISRMVVNNYTMQRYTTLIHFLNNVLY